MKFLKFELTDEESGLPAVYTSSFFGMIKAKYVYDEGWINSKTGEISPKYSYEALRITRYAYVELVKFKKLKGIK